MRFDNAWRSVVIAANLSDQVLSMNTRVIGLRSSGQRRTYHPQVPLAWPPTSSLLLGDRQQSRFAADIGAPYNARLQ